MQRAKPILIADDDSDDRELIAAAFSEVLPVEKLEIVPDGTKVLHYLDHLADDNELPGLIMLDLNMPLLDGFSTLKKLKTNDRYKHIPVVILTTSKNMEEMNKCLQLGASDYLTKPNNFTGNLIASRALDSFVGTSYG
jgi:CheY-like chemotaxis protein